ncbi:DUF971 domain-containing protein [Litoribacillus peritrichatus]|uniref:DUF971 domain-containing protein n=1 Tax=Litoribacillus peritrichatus TaxID=718191 RepID=A0ABP7MTJ5_9GAMM
MLKPVKIHYRKNAKSLLLTYPEQEYALSAEFLRVHSPSAEVRGHGHQGAILQVEKQDVGILLIEPIGNYALKFTFDDEHDSGIYTWEYLKDLCENHDKYWNEYLQALKKSGQKRQSNLIFKAK